MTKRVIEPRLARITVRHVANETPDLIEIDRSSVSREHLAVVAIG